ncbi:MAG: hypothetical protein AWU54_1637 [Candidatus Frackibacter sp. T328-2]|nr:MAG: hypothetical protein AWU54_1637 [Candidatus Frackibacter sp. T328-2]
MSLAKSLGLPSNLDKLHEWASLHNIYIATENFDLELWGYATKSDYDSYLVLINNRLCYEMQQKVLMHELVHILKHSPGSHPIYKDQYDIEKEADELAEKIIKEASG